MKANSGGTQISAFAVSLCCLMVTAAAAAAATARDPNDFSMLIAIASSAFVARMQQQMPCEGVISGSSRRQRQPDTPSLEQ